MSDNRNYRGFNGVHEDRRYHRYHRAERNRTRYAEHLTDALLVDLAESDYAKPMRDCEFDFEVSVAHEQALIEDRDRDGVLPDWERELLDGDWDVMGDVMGEEVAEFFADEDDFRCWEPSAWLAHVSIEECREAMPEGFSIETPPTRAPAAYVAGYIRVHELAKKVGISNRNLIRHLQVNGEYVKAASSNVALAVVEQILAEQEYLVRTYGEREDIPLCSKDALDALRHRLLWG